MRKNILVIEDNESTRALLRQLLKGNGYGVLEAADGIEGLEMVEEEDIDLILLDLQMPFMDGCDVIRRLRDNPKYKNLKVIAVTSFAMKGDRERALETGFDEYVTKPIDTRKLPEIIKEVLAAISKARA
jgi:CheY-like chemotaxis protein